MYGKLLYKLLQKKHIFIITAKMLMYDMNVIARIKSERSKTNIHFLIHILTIVNNLSSC